MAWTTPTNVTASSVASSSHMNTEVIANLQYLYAGLTWTTFTPTWNNVTLGTGSASYGRYRRIGNVVDFQAGFKLGTGGLLTGTLSMTGPLTVEAEASFTFGPGAGVIFAQDGNNRYAAAFTPQQGSTTWIFRPAYDGQTGWAATVPFTWGVGDELHASGTITVQ